MPRPCSICAHTDRHAIDQALALGGIATILANQYGVSVDALQRHKDRHLPAALTEACAAEARTHALDIIAQLRQINHASNAILQAARAQEDPLLALRAIDRIHKQVELQAKLLGDLDERPTVTLTLSPEWITLRSFILQALTPFPEARQALALALMEVTA